MRAPIHAQELRVVSLFFDPFAIVIPREENSYTTQHELRAFLKNSSFVFFNKDFAPNYNDKLIEICGRMGFIPEITHEVNNVHSILQLIEAGLGVSILPSSLRQQYAHLGVSFIELEDIPVNTEVVLAYKYTNKSAALKWFIDHYKGIVLAK